MNSAVPVKSTGDTLTAAEANSIVAGLRNFKSVEFLISYDGTSFTGQTPLNSDFDPITFTFALDGIIANQINITASSPIFTGGKTAMQSGATRASGSTFFVKTYNLSDTTCALRFFRYDDIETIAPHIIDYFQEVRVYN